MCLESVSARVGVPVRALLYVYVCVSLCGSVWMPVGAHRAWMQTSYLRGRKPWPLGKSHRTGVGWELYLGYNTDSMWCPEAEKRTKILEKSLVHASFRLRCPRTSP